MWGWTDWSGEIQLSARLWSGQLVRWGRCRTRRHRRQRTRPGKSPNVLSPMTIAFQLGFECREGRRGREGRRPSTAVGSAAASDPMNPSAASEAAKVTVAEGEVLDGQDGK